MKREFIVHNVRKNLKIQDSAFPGQESRSDTEKFMEQLFQIFGRTFNETLNNAHIYLRAGRSMYIAIDTDTRTIEYQLLDIGKIRKIHPKHEEDEKDTGFKELEERMGGMMEFQNNLINKYNYMGAKK